VYSSLRSTKVVDNIFNIDLITDTTENIPKSNSRSKKSYKDVGGVFRMTIIKNKNVINMDYVYYDQSTIQNKISSISSEGHNNVVLSNNEIYDKLEKYIENTVKEDSPKINYTQSEINKYNSPYTKENIKKYKENYYLSFNQVRRKNFENKTGWEEVKIPPTYICYNTINGNSNITINVSYYNYDLIHIIFN